MRFRWVGILLFPMMLGCGGTGTEPTTAADESAANPPHGFHPETAGTIRGRVTWEGPIPRPAPYHVSPAPMQDGAPGGVPQRDNPNAPLIDPQTRAVGNAVVFLRGVRPGAGRRWDHPPVQIELVDFTIQVGQLPGRPAYGFVRRGDAIRVVSRQPVFHSLHADGAGFFTLAFPDPNEPLTRRLSARGVVELSSAAGYFWTRAYLFVDDHPYYACSRLDGNFELPQVPPGDYELACWMPNWIEDRRNRDPESGLVTRIFYRPAHEIVKRVRVAKRGTSEVRFTFTSGDLSAP